MVMLRLLSRGLLVAALGLGYVAHHEHVAYADDDDDSEDSGDDDSGGSKGGDDGEGDGEGGGEEEDEDAKDQPPITAGGMFTMRTYPVREISR
ncbi:MAG TPA: hypothetical protein VLB44_17455, partial [Kofleriaceae bacterium]|nr:hypothetical protein [Kofleriaceae bacterium]